MNPDQTPSTDKPNYEDSSQAPDGFTEEAAPSEANTTLNPEKEIASTTFTAMSSNASGDADPETALTAMNEASSTVETPILSGPPTIEVVSPTINEAPRLQTEDVPTSVAPFGAVAESADKHSENISGMPTTSDSSPVVGAVVSVGSGDGVLVPALANKPKRGKHNLLIAVVSALLLIGLCSGYVFAYYIPNRPGNVWNAALVNTGKAYDTMTQYATATAKSVKGVDIQGSYKIKGAIVSDGTFTGKSLGSEGQFNGSISGAGLKINYDVRSLKSTGDTPDLYLKVSGIQGLGDLFGSGDPTLVQALSGLDNQWYVVDHTLTEQIASSSAGSGSNATTAYSAKNFDSLMKAVGEPSKTYLFTDKADKAVFVNKSIVGAEKRDGRSVYHYKAGVDKTHLKTYLKALCTGLEKDTLGKQLLENQLVTTNCDDFAKRADSIDATQTADVWVDKGTKLVNAVRFTDKNQSANFTEISQNYQGGVEYPFGLKFQTKVGDSTTVASLAGSLNSQTNTLKVSGTLDSKGSSPSTGSFDFSFKPNTEKTFKVTKPENAKNIIQLMNDLGLGQLLGAGNASTSASLPALATASSHSIPI
jgi:hypothetical protein